MDFFDVINNRFSCKSFSDRAVEPDKLVDILQAGRVAPTAKNSQPQHIVAIRSREGLALVDRLTPCRYNAPLVLAVAYNKDKVYHYPGGVADSGAEDAAIVATHMMLAAHALGLDSCWLNFFDPKRAKQALELPDNEEVVMLLDIGYAADGAGPLPNHESRKSVTETVTYL